MSTSEDALPEGLYETLIDESLARRLEVMEAGGYAITTAQLDPGEAHLALSQHLRRLLERVLRGLADRKNERSVALANALLRAASAADPKVLPPDEARLTGALLEAIVRRPSLGDAAPPPSPGVPLGQSALLVNANREERLGAELAREFASADRVDLLCSFLRVSGVRTLQAPLTEHLRRGRPFRVLTTTYTGATQRAAIERLVAAGAEVKVSYDTKRSPLHAKAWIFHRDSGFTTAYIGSSNLSGRAMTEGLEWNVRVSATSAPPIVDKAIATFETYWASQEFERYTEDAGARLDEALARARGGDGEPAPDGPHFDLRPYAFQEKILEQLAAARGVHSRHRNLVVAATGTGKTMIAAFDYARLGAHPRPSLLFVAHRKEILHQSRAVFRHVLRDHGFGELLVGGERPTRGRHVFASIQSLDRSAGDLDPAAFDVVIVDEFHHAAAPTYDRLLERLRPRELLGLTATPERADGLSVLDHFGGHIAAEIRLWDAIGRGLLCPFQYFGVRDSVDLDHLKASAGSYRASDLDHLYTGDDARALLILRALHERVAEPRSIRALGFCVSIEHARFMAERFTASGLPALAVTSKDPQDLRRQALPRLRQREVNVLFVVDLYNEGVDIPYLDTLLLLRPTESAPLFLQQLGRGLRLHPDKDALTVLDFIGLQRREFRFERSFGALVRGGARELADAAQSGFPYLPAGCSITLEPAALEVVLAHLKRRAKPTTRRLTEALREAWPGHEGFPPLSESIERLGVDVADLYRGGRCYSDLLARAGLLKREAEVDPGAAKALGRVLHFDDPARFAALDRSLAAHAGAKTRDAAEPDPATQMTYAALAERDGPTVAPGLLATIAADADLSRELAQLRDHLVESIDHDARREPALPEGAPLRLHCRYSMVEVMAALGQTTDDGRQFKRAFRGAMRCGALVLIFITLRKSTRHYSPSTMYEDYAIDREHVHWQSPNDVAESTDLGADLVDASRGFTPMIFIRESVDARGQPRRPYAFLGAADCVDHRGARPMTITWRLRAPMPAALFERYRVATD